MCCCFWMFVNKLFTYLTYLKNKRSFNVKSSTHYFHMKTKTLTDIRICISVPLRKAYNPQRLYRHFCLNIYLYVPLVNCNEALFLSPESIIHEQKIRFFSQIFHPSRSFFITIFCQAATNFSHLPEH